MKAKIFFIGGILMVVESIIVQSVFLFILGGVLILISLPLGNLFKKKHFENLKKLGWFDHTPEEYLPYAEKVLQGTLSWKNPYVSSIFNYEEFQDNPKIITFFEKVEEKYFACLDLRTFEDDPENLSERGVCKFLESVNKHFKVLRKESLFENTQQEEWAEDYRLFIDSIEDTVFTTRQFEELYWGAAVDGVINILDTLLIKKGYKEKAYFSWGGDNSIYFFLLTDNLYEYLIKNNLEGGLGPIFKSIDQQTKFYKSTSK